MEISEFHMHMFNMATAEEVDELESWEDLNDEILDRNLAKMRAMTTPVKNNVGGPQQPSVVFVANDIRTRYLPSEPTVKILKRPSSVPGAAGGGGLQTASGDGVLMNGDVIAAGGGAGGLLGGRPPRQPVKTLQQRELEYAEARLRILGEAQSPEEKQTSPTFIERVRRIQDKTSPPSSSNPSVSDQPSPGNQIMVATTTTSSPASFSFLNSCNSFTTATTTILTPPNFDTVYVASPPYIIPHQITSPVMVMNKFQPHHMVNHLVRSQIIRQPRGPDGTRGFRFHQPR